MRPTPAIPALRKATSPVFRYPASVRHQHRNLGFLQNFVGHAADQVFAELAVLIGAHDQKARALFTAEVGNRGADTALAGAPNPFRPDAVPFQLRTDIGVLAAAAQRFVPDGE
jgi:hypothetical protein